jgi:uncharacterized protein YaaR (DUF327 family)
VLIVDWVLNVDSCS